MATYTQSDRLLAVTTSLGEDVLLLVGFSGREEISEMFRYELDLLAPNDKVSRIDFSKLLGQPVTVELLLPDDEKRHFNGICSRVSQGRRDDDFTAYRMEVVPKLWLLDRSARSRIFQHESVPDILKEVLQGIEIDDKVQGTFQPRNHVVQYRETDLQFASRLMQDEGIFFYFKHTESQHTMVLANTPQGHLAIAPAEMIFEEVSGGVRDEDRVLDWSKCQDLRSGKFTLWDHCFELPDKHLEATASIQQSVEVGSDSHKLSVGGNNQFEIYEYPGQYAHRFDGIDKGGGEQPAELQKIFEDNQRTTEIRMQEEAAASLLIQGTSSCRHFVAGHKFTLTNHVNADGEYVLRSVTHSASLSGYRSGEVPGGTYENGFACIPSALPFRPPCAAAKPVVPGTQTAEVVGPGGEEIFTDKYGRVKIQFHWDRDGQNDAESSCWVRVATPWAGKQWGMIHIPRIGQEVIVAFVDGDPDQPIVVGSVYNAAQMPPYELPNNKTQSGLKSRSSMNGTDEDFNELRFEDKKDEEEIYFHAEKDFQRIVENNDTLKVGFEKKDDGNQSVEVFNNRSLKVGDPQAKEGSLDVEIWKDQTTTLKTGDRKVSIEMGNDSLEIKMGNQKTSLDLGKSETEAMQSIELKVGQSSIKVDQMGVTIKGMMVKLDGSLMTEVKGSALTKVESSGVLTVKGGVMMIG